MDILKEIACALGYADAENLEGGHFINERLRSISKKLTTKPGDVNFTEDCERAEKEVDAVGAAAFGQLFGQIVQAQEPKERVYKIKPVAKGQRIKVKSASGVRFSFGDVWCDAVRACKGIALNEANREKLNMHGTHLGVINPEVLAPRELCSKIASLM